MKKEEIKIMPLGAGSEVGRSCILLSYLNTKILFDCGVHPAFTGTSCLPFLDLIDLSEIDAVFITHFHLDHAGALPFLTEKTDFKGRVFMTHPTKAIMKFLLNDYIRIINASITVDLYTEDDLLNCHNKIEAIDYHQTIKIKDIEIIGYNAGHVLGAAMFLAIMKRTRLLYTGDFSREEDRHLRQAEYPGNVDILITEATYGVQCHLPRDERERRFTNSIINIIKRGGNVLLPVFALGRAQELLLILDELWERKSFLQNYPIFYASALAKRCMGIYKAYVNMMNNKILEVSRDKNPFAFKYVQNMAEEKEFIDFQRRTVNKTNCVMMASPGMLQSGFSRILFDLWCNDKKNGIVIPGYVVNGTLAKEIMGEPQYIKTMEGEKKELLCSVDYISFSAHVDYLQNSNFIKEINARYVFLVHGEATEMARLKNALEKDGNVQKDIEIFTLRNCEEKIIEVESEYEGRLYGNIEKGKKFDALVFQKNEVEIIPVENISSVGLSELFFNQTATIPFKNDRSYIINLLRNAYKLEEREGKYYIKNIELTIDDNQIVLNWDGKYEDDIIVYSIHTIIKNEIPVVNLSDDEKLIKIIKNFFNVKYEKGLISVENLQKESLEIKDFKLVKRSSNESFNREIEEIMSRVENLI